MTNVNPEEQFVRVIVNEPDVAEVTIVEQTNKVVVSEEDPNLVYVSVNGARGPTGPTGASGSQILTGTGSPSNALGDDNDIYIDSDTGEFWGPKANGSWGAEPFFQTGLPTRYVHTQAAASSTWTINHNLNAYPAVMVVDTASTVVIGEVSYLSTSQVQVSFSAPFSGFAYLT